MKLEKLTESEKKFAEENHNLVYRFLHKNGYSIGSFYNIVIFGYLKAVQIYHRRKDLQIKYDFPFIACQYMRSEVGNHFRMKNTQKRTAVANSFIYFLQGSAENKSHSGKFNWLGETVRKLSDYPVSIYHMFAH